MGVLFRSGHRVSARLAGYVHEFDTVELNASFYRWPEGCDVRRLATAAAEGSVKAHRGLTPFRCLKSPEPWVERFERCRRLLGDRAEMRGCNGIPNTSWTTRR